MTLALLDFLNSREDAILVWALLILGFVTYKDPLGIGGAVLGVVRAMLAPPLLVLYGSALGYAAALVYVASEFGLWHTTALKATVYWFVGTATVLVAHAITGGSRRDRRFLQKIGRRLVGVTIFIEFAVNLYAFPLAVEFVGVGVALTFSMMQAYLDHYPAPDPRVRKLVDGVVATVGFVYVGYFAVRGVPDLLDGVGRERVEEFLVGPALTIALIPFLYAVSWWSKREQENLRKRFRARHAFPDEPEETWPEEPLADSDPDRLAS